MKVVALVSGGKDSCYNMMQCVREGHEIIALANLRPKTGDEMDSYMYQTVGHQAIEYYAEAMNLPLYRRTIEGRSKNTGSEYSVDKEDEVEDLVALLEEVRKNHEIEGVAVGAILSNYQRVRVENVCSRLGLTSLAFLWRRNQNELLKEMIDCQVEAVIIKVAAMGLKENDLGKTLEQIYPKMEKLNSEFGLNMCGEGGEYETFTLDCPLFNKKLVVDEQKVIIHSDAMFAPVAYLNFTDIHLDDKNVAHIAMVDRISTLPMKSSQQCVLELEIEEDCEIITVDYSKSSDILTQLSTIDNCVSEYPRGNDSNLWIGGLSSLDTENLENATSEVMEKLGDILQSRGFEFKDICIVHLYVRDMNNFARINDIYKQYFSLNPPVRVCVEADLCINQPLIMDCYARSSKNDVIMASDDVTVIRTMHVQGISHWAPANIGPYSQCKQIGRQIHVAGQIPLVPGSMKIVEGGIVTQSRLALRHVTRVLEAMSDGKITTCDVTFMICYVTNSTFIDVAKTEFSRENSTCEAVYVVIPKLPRNALIEWEAVAHLDTDTLNVSKSANIVEGFSVESEMIFEDNDNQLFTAVVRVSLTEKNEKFCSDELLANLKIVIEQGLMGIKLNGGVVRTFYCGSDFKSDDLLRKMSEALGSARIDAALSLVPVLALETDDMVLCLVIT